MVAMFFKSNGKNMTLIKRGLLAALLASGLFAGVQAQEATIRKNLGERIPQLAKIDEISKTPIPGGLSFENFEFREPFRAGQEQWFGFTRSSPATAFGFPYDAAPAGRREPMDDPFRQHQFLTVLDRDEADRRYRAVVKG